MTGRAARPWFVSLALVTLLSAASRARADDASGPRVSVDLNGCDLAFAGEVKRIAGVELRAVVVDASDSRLPVTRAVVACHEGVAELWVSDPVTSKLVGRTVSLGSTAASAQARLIALSVAELVLASWDEVDSNPEPKVQPVAPADPAVRASVRSVVQAAKAAADATLAPGRAGARPSDAGVPRIALDVMADARAFTGGAYVFGGAVRSAVRLAPTLALRFDLGADFGDVPRSSGYVSVLTQHGSVALAWASGVFLLWAGARGGFARLEGQPIDHAVGHVESGGWAGPEAGLDLTVWPRAIVHGIVGVSVGGALMGVRGDVQGDSPVAVLGGWAALTLGLGISKP